MRSTGCWTQEPHGGKLINTFGDVDVSKADMTVELNDRQSCDTQLICNGGFSPLTGFMTEEEYNGVVADMRLPSGLIMGACTLAYCPILGLPSPADPFSYLGPVCDSGLPVVMDTFDDSIEVGKKVLLTYKGCNMAMMEVTSKFTPDKPLECIKVRPSYAPSCATTRLLTLPKSCAMPISTLPHSVALPSTVVARASST